VYPPGLVNRAVDHVGVFLKCSKTNGTAPWSCSTQFTLAIHPAVTISMVCHTPHISKLRLIFYPASSKNFEIGRCGWGWPQFIHEANLVNTLKEGTLSVDVTIEFIADK